MMFGVGLHFSLRDLASVKHVAVPGALLQMGLSTALGWLSPTQLWGWSTGASLVLGLAMSIASTVVLLRGLDRPGHAQHLRRQDRRRLADARRPCDCTRFWCCCPRSSVIPTPSGAPTSSTIVVGARQGGRFIALVLVVGVRVLPWVLVRRRPHPVARAVPVGCVLARREHRIRRLRAVRRVVRARRIPRRDRHGRHQHPPPDRSRSAHRSGTCSPCLFFVSVGMAVDPRCRRRSPRQGDRARAPRRGRQDL